MCSIVCMCLYWLHAMCVQFDTYFKDFDKVLRLYVVQCYDNQIDTRETDDHCKIDLITIIEHMVM